MVRKYITRDSTQHQQNTEYLSDEDEYIKFEIFSFDHDFTQTYVVEKNSLTGENAVKTSFKEWSCLKSKDMINPMEFTLNYKVKQTGLYRIDLIYEKNKSIHKTKEYNTSKDLTGWYDIYKSSVKSEHKAQVFTETLPKNATKQMKKDFEASKQNALKLANKSDTDKTNTATPLKFEGEQNALKRKTIFKQLNTGDYKFEFAVPHNCYVFGAIVRKVITFYGTNNDEAGSQLQLREATHTISDMTKASELEIEIGYDNNFEYDGSQSGLYMEYMDECNLYVKNSEGNIKRIFGGYVSTPLPTNDRRTITVHCADRLKDGENKYILDNLLLQNGETDPKELDYDLESSISFEKHGEVLRYLCRLYETTLQNNVDSNYLVEGEKFGGGFVVSFGKNKDVKKIPVTNGQVTINKNSVTLRNNSSGKKKQVFTLFQAKKKPVNITGYNNLHITYGLGDVKTEHKLKETVNVDVGGATAGSQKFNKCGVSQDGKYVMAIGTISSKKDTGKYGDYFRGIFKNKCPHCGKSTLKWDSCRSDSKCIRGGSKRNFPVPPIETEITCEHCDSDFSVKGNEKDSPWKKLTSMSITKSSKAEQDKLHKGEMVAVPNGKVSISSDDIFKAIKASVKGFTHSTGTGTTASYLEKHGTGDCWAWSDKISKELKKYKVNHYIVEYPTSESNNHRSVLYQNSKGEYVDFPYSKYGFPKGTHATSKSKNGAKIYKYTIGGRINQATTTGNTNKSQTVETTVTKGYDKETPFQGYLDIVYSTTQSLSAKKKHIYVDFTQKAKSKYTLSGLNPVWVNNTSKRLTLTGFINYAKAYSNSETIYLHSISFITPKIQTTNTDKNTTWYTNDKSTKDNSSCKIKLYDISFNNESGVQPAPLDSCGKTVNEMMNTIVEQANYIVEIEYGLHRHQDKIFFKINDNNTPVFHATEGDNNNILEWGNISYNPANELFNMSRCVFKNNISGKYNYVESKFIDSILKYQEQCTLITENEGIGEKEAYWNARHNEKFNPEQTYTFTITVKGRPDVNLKELVNVTANMKKLNTLKEVESITTKYNFTDKPSITTELGLGELSPDIQVTQNIKKLRDNAKKSTTSFMGGAIPIIESSNIYEWEN